MLDRDKDKEILILETNKETLISPYLSERKQKLSILKCNTGFLGLHFGKLVILYIVS